MLFTKSVMKMLATLALLSFAAGAAIPEEAPETDDEPTPTTEADATKSSPYVRPWWQAPVQQSMPTSAGVCGTHYKGLFDTFYVKGYNWDMDLLHPSGSGLKHALGRCGAVTGWHFMELHPEPGDEPWTFVATGRMGIERHHCIGKAMKRAGAPQDGGYCGSERGLGP